MYPLCSITTPQTENFIRLKSFWLILLKSFDIWGRVPKTFFYYHITFSILKLAWKACGVPFWVWNPSQFETRKDTCILFSVTISLFIGYLTIKHHLSGLLIRIRLKFNSQLLHTFGQILIRNFFGKIHPKFSPPAKASEGTASSFWCYWLGTSWHVIFSAFSLRGIWCQLSKISTTKKRIRRIQIFVGRNLVGFLCRM